MTFSKTTFSPFVQLFLECRLLERVLEAWHQNDELETNSKNSRKGYMAHLTKIANVMVSSFETKNVWWGPLDDTHLNREKIESNFSIPGIQGHQENALIKSFEMSPHLICL